MKAIEAGQTWKSEDPRWRAVYLTAVKEDDAGKTIKYYYEPGHETDIRELPLERFLEILARGKYECEVPAEKLEKSKPEPVLKLSKTEDTGKKYLRTIRSKRQRSPDGKLLTIEVDVYCVIDSYGPFSAAMNHAIKKVLCPGQRGNKDKITDLKEAIVSIQHEIDSETELVQPEQVKPNDPKDRKKNTITLPPQDKLPPFVKDGDMIFVGELYRKENCHEFYEYTSVRGQGLRKEKQTWYACRFCGQLLVEYDLDHQQCPKLNSP